VAKSYEQMLYLQNEQVKCMRNKHIIVSNSNHLIRITSEDLAYVSSDGSYSTMHLVDGTEHMFSFNLRAFEKLLESQLGLDSQQFIRLGKCLIINSDYIYLINVSSQEVILSDMHWKEKIKLRASKEALKSLKNLIEVSFKNRRINI